MKNIAIVLGALACVVLFQTMGHSNTANLNAGRYAMYTNAADGRNYLLDTLTGDSWVMHNMQRKGRHIGVWVPNFKTNNFDEEEAILNNSANRYDIRPVPGGSK